jgi:hypothetical protein
MNPRRWIVPLALLIAGSVVFGLSLAHGEGLALIWVPAVLLAAAWPWSDKTNARECLRRLKGGRGAP